MKEYFAVPTAARVSRMVNGLVSINHVYSRPLTQVTVCARCVNVRVFPFRFGLLSFSLSLSGPGPPIAFRGFEHQGFNRPLMRVLVLRSHSEESANGWSMTWQVIVSDDREFFGVPRGLCTTVDIFLGVSLLRDLYSVAQCHCEFLLKEIREKR